MGRIAVLAGVAHDIAHHATSGLSYLSPHLALALSALHATALRILQTHRLQALDLSSMVFHATPALRDQ